MSATSDPTQDAPREAVSFDDAFAALPREGVPAEDAPEQAQPDEWPSQAPAQPAATPGEDEPDDDDEALPFEQRFARSNRREQKLQAERDSIAAERQRAIDQANGYKGNLAQEKARREAAEADRSDFERRLTDANAQRDADYQAAINAAPDARDGTGTPTKADLTQAWNIEKRERDVAQKEARLNFQEQQKAEQDKRLHAEHVGNLEHGIRQHAIPELVQAIPRYAELHGLPASEVRDVIARLNTPEVLIAMQNMPVKTSDPQAWDVDKYRTFLADQAQEEIVRRAAAYKERQAGATRQELAQTTYRQEQPVGQAGGDQFEDLGQYGTDFDAAFAANSRNHQRQLTAR